MALDNPSYFTVPGGTAGAERSGGRSRFSLLRRNARATRGSAAPKPKSTERYSTPPGLAQPQPQPQPRPLVREPSPEGLSECRLKKSFRSLLRDPIRTQMLVLGMPRPSDVAPAEMERHSPGKDRQGARSARQPGSPTSADDGYCNVPSDGAQRRRHSIGAYFARRSSPQSAAAVRFPEENFRGPSLRNAEPAPVRRRRRCDRCLPPKDAIAGDMDDILIVSSNRSQAADLWVRYLKTCFDQIRKNRNKPPFRIASLCLEEAAADGEEAAADERARAARLTVVILCPVLLEHVARHPDRAAAVTSLFRPDRVLAMLLGVDERAAVAEEHKKGLSNYSRWRRMESVKDRDEKFVGDFLGAAMDIISKGGGGTQPSGVERCHFMLTPKKVNKSQNKVLVLLNDPITKEDEIAVEIVRNGETFAMTSVKKRNPYTVIFRVPEDLLTVSTLVSVRVERNGRELGSKLLKCESQLYALDQILRSCDNPVEFMCQALNLVPCDREKLDDFLVAALLRNLPPNFNLLQTSGLGHLHRGVISKEEYPTLLHFAARFGLEKLAWTLLECPGGELACDIRNICELTPAEMAESGGHARLAGALCGYMQMTEFTSAYTYLKGMTEEEQRGGGSPRRAVPEVGSQEYLNPRPVSETYQVPPSPRPLPTQTPVGYLPMTRAADRTRQKTEDAEESNPERNQRKNSSSGESRRREEVEQLGRNQSGNGIQEELIEIINDFKNNVFTIAEVEKLVEEWRNRNDVQQSFREKQEQLNKMREEYERVQQKLKEEMREIGRPSPVERLRNFFRGKSKAAGEAGKKQKAADASAGSRPASSLSIRSVSSSSSGRLSTGSRCSGTSLGDSGTHSDAESERKCRVGQRECCDHRRGTENYDVPPTPIALFPGLPKTAAAAQARTQAPAQPQRDVADAAASGPEDPRPAAPDTGTLYHNLSVEGCVPSPEPPLDYINLPTADGRVTAKCVIIGSEDEEEKPSSFSEDALPDYVNVEPPEVEISCT